MNKEQLIELIRFTAGEIEPTSISKQCAESILDDFLKVEQLTLTDVGSNEVKCCSCDYPIVRNDGNIDYCGNCGDDLE